MIPPQCLCPINRDCVVIPQNRQDHIRRHFTSPSDESFEPRGSFFLEGVITPEALFAKIIHELRNGRKPEERGWRGRYVYCVPFPSNVGLFPFAPHVPHTSNVKIICDFVVCRYCLRHCPSEVISAFPA